MPARTITVEPEVSLSHAGVVVHHTYKDDDFDAGRNRYWFTLDSASDDASVCMREFDVPCKSMLQAHPPFTSMSEPRYFDASPEERAGIEAQWKDWLKDGGGEEQAIRAVLISAAVRTEVPTPSSATLVPRRRKTTR